MPVTWRARSLLSLMFLVPAALAAETATLRPVAPAEWTSVTGDAEYARNFQRRSLRPAERFAQIVTVYDLPMTDDRRLGDRIAPGEYLELFKVGDATSVVVQLRLDRGQSWLLSRQRFSLDRFPELNALDPEASAEARMRFRVALQDEIDRARYTLRARFR